MSKTFCFATLLICCNVNGFAQEAFKYEKQIETLVRPYIENEKLFAVSISAVKDGESWFGNWGQLSETDDSKPNHDTVYEIGSISKVFTSLLLAEAVDAGKLKLEMPIGELLPAIEDSKTGQEISLLHLSIHTSGEIVNRLVGKYQLAPGIVIDVIAKKDRLMVHLTGQSYLQVIPESDTVWNYRDVKAQLRFDLPEKGHCSKVTLHQNGRKMPAPRIKQ